VVSLHAATNYFAIKYFSVRNAGSGTLTGMATMVITNSTNPFTVYSNAVLNISAGQTQNVYIALNTTNSGNFTNWVLFSSSGGNSTNIVYGAVLPSSVSNFTVTSSSP
jgi:hypothetical protein